VYRHAELLDERDAADVADTLSRELYYVGRHEEAVEVRRSAVARWHAIGDRAREGESLLGLGAPLVMIGSHEHNAVVAEGVAVLAELGPSCALANALTSQASGHMLARELQTAVEVGERAIALAEELECELRLVHALIQVGTAQLMAGDTEAGLARMVRGRELAEGMGERSEVALYFTQLGSGSGEIRRYDLAVPALQDALEWCEPWDMHSHALYASAWLARCELALGEWDAAGERATQVLALPSCTGISRFTALFTVGLLRARRGDPGVWDALDEALTIARETEHLQRLWPIAAARAEAAWLEDRIADEIDLVDDVFKLAASLDYPWAIEELSWWKSQAGCAPSATGHAQTPFGLQLAGRFDEAAKAWTALSSPYEAAAVRLGGDVEGLVEGFTALDALGAEPLTRRFASALRDAGERVPRRASATTRANPFALTRRELDVLALVAEGRTNAEIANELFISAKTVDHHVSNILGKLRVSTRREAGREARRLGILPT
jgi:DNA-binding CsgD family transcriptional regulator